MKIVHSAHSEADNKPKRKKLPMDKDPVFLAMLRQQIIEDHNRKIDKMNADLEKQKKPCCNRANS